MMVYNAERYLRQAIDSILAQTFKDFELLVLDDASRDRSVEIIQSYSDPRIRIISNENNRGVAYSRSKALPLARGEYIAVLDADDVALPERLQVQVSYLDSHPDICLVGSSCQVIGEDGSVRFIYHEPTDLLTIRWLLLFGNCFAHSTVMFRRREALSVGGYGAAVYAGEDIDLFVRLAAAEYKLTNLECPLAQWRDHPKSLVKTELPAVLDHFVWTAVRSIRLQTGLEIDFATARYLQSDRAFTTEDHATIAHAYQVILDVLAAMLQKYGQARFDRVCLGKLALIDTNRLKLKQQGSPLFAYRNAWRILQLVGYDLLTTSGGRRSWLRVILPRRFISIIRSAKEGLRR